MSSILQIVRRHWSAAVAAAVAMVLVMIATAAGVGLSPDSTYYLSSGMHLAKHGSLVDFTGRVLTVFPPGLPALVGIGVKLGWTPDATTRLLDIVAAGCTAVLADVLAGRHLERRVLRRAAPLVVAVSPALLVVTSMAWSEPLYVALVLGFVVALEQLDRAASSRQWWMVAGAGVLVSWAASSMRYAGLAMLPVGFISVLWQNRRRPRVAAARALIVVVGCAIGPMSWMLRNRAADGTVLGPRSPSQRNLLDVGADLISTVERWVLPVGPRDVARVMAIALAICAVAGLVVIARGVRRSSSGTRSSVRRTSIVPLLGVAGAQLVYVVVAELRYQLDPLDARLLAPAYVPCVLLALFLADRASSTDPGRRDRVRARTVAASLAATCVVVLLGAAGLDRSLGASEGLGFRSPSFTRSPLAMAVDDAAPTAVVVTNGEMQSYHVWAVTRRSPILQVFADDFGPTEHRLGCVEGTVLYARFAAADDVARPSGRVELIEMAQLADGRLYEVIPSDALRASCPSVEGS